MRGYHRRAKKASRDANHPEIVSALNALGFLVLDLAEVGGGVPDLLIGRRGALHFVEVKNPAGLNGAVARGGGLTPMQEGFIALWKSTVAVKVHIVTSLDDVMQLNTRLP